MEAVALTDPAGELAGVAVLVLWAEQPQQQRTPMVRRAELAHQVLSQDPRCTTQVAAAAVHLVKATAATAELVAVVVEVHTQALLALVAAMAAAMVRQDPVPAVTAEPVAPIPVAEAVVAVVPEVTQPVVVALAVQVW